MVHRRRTIGLLGGIGSGKTTVGGLFQDLGADLVSADEIVHRLLRQEGVRKRLAAALGCPLPRGDRALRRFLAERIFRAAEDRRRVEGVLHPLVDREIRRRLARRATAPAVVLDVPLLLEAGMTHYCDTLVFVQAPGTVRLSRVEEARGWKPAEVRAREHAQASLAAKRAASDWLIDNGDGLDATRAQVAELWESLVDDDAVRSVRRHPHGKGEGEAEEEDPRRPGAVRG